ncbi:hypothetical protein BV25DRAFT_1484399 [Artomyces pyxidatus]|uniref:Uncharacterized protein n=1 Tax=Artomyces pyxidatus TaxID=48021 RepID=A0ACB8TC13_9AGAM|nr:hypothetical protein BV25DRAFT_1484399 [Artomyces pyxidatus]
MLARAFLGGRNGCAFVSESDRRSFPLHRRPSAPAYTVSAALELGVPARRKDRGVARAFCGCRHPCTPWNRPLRSDSFLDPAARTVTCSLLSLLYKICNAIVIAPWPRFAGSEIEEMDGTLLESFQRMRSGHSLTGHAALYRRSGRDGQGFPSVHPRPDLGMQARGSKTRSTDLIEARRPA